jgi:hypothetical protein
MWNEEKKNIELTQFLVTWPFMKKQLLQNSQMYVPLDKIQCTCSMYLWSISLVLILSYIYVHYILSLVLLQLLCLILPICVRNVPYEVYSRKQSVEWRYVPRIINVQDRLCSTKLSFFLSNSIWNSVWRVLSSRVWSHVVQRSILPQSSGAKSTLVVCFVYS